MIQRILTDTDLARYAAHLRDAGRSTGTLDKYLRDLRQFCAWLAGAPLEAVHLIEWKEALLATGLAPVTINSKLAALNGFFRWMGWPELHASYFKVQRQLFRADARTLTRRDYDCLLQTARRRGQRRLSLLMQTICGTGIRVSELRNITVVAVRSGKAEIYLKGKVRVILLPQKLCHKLLRYARAQKIAHGEIFLTVSGKSLGRRQIWDEMKRLAKASGVAASKVFPHNLRHLFATAFYEHSHDIVRLADVLGHSSIDTTRIYLTSTGSEHLRTLEALGLVP